MVTAYWYCFSNIQKSTLSSSLWTKNYMSTDHHLITVDFNTTRLKKCWKSKILHPLLHNLTKYKCDELAKSNDTESSKLQMLTDEGFHNYSFVSESYWIKSIFQTNIIEAMVSFEIQHWTVKQKDYFLLNTIIY